MSALDYEHVSIKIMLANQGTAVYGLHRILGNMAIGYTVHAIIDDFRIDTKFIFVNMKITVFWDLIMWFFLVDGGNSFLQNIGIFIPTSWYHTHRL
jgi:hypothetical protein